MNIALRESCPSVTGYRRHPVMIWRSLFISLPGFCVPFLKRWGGGGGGGGCGDGREGMTKGIFFPLCARIERYVYRFKKSRKK